jgi:Fusaric acid resistance protein-like
MEKTLNHVAGAFRWSTEKEVTAIEIAVSALAMTVPALLAARGHHTGLGLIGGMAMSGTVAHGRLRTQAASAGAALLALVLAVGLACALARFGNAWQISMLAIAGLAGVIGGFDRAVVVASMRFIFYLVMVGGIVSITTANPLLIFAVVIGGALFAVVLHLAMAAVVEHIHGHSALDTEEERKPTAKHKFNRLRRSLMEPAGWQYPIRLVSCLGAVSFIHLFFPDRDVHWAALALVLLIERRPERLPLKTTQRVIGVLFGVCCAGLLSLLVLPVWADVLVVAALGGVRPILRARNYLAYSIVMTPLMMMAMGTADHALPASALLDRLFATVFAACLVLLVNQVTIYLLPETAAPKA